MACCAGMFFVARKILALSRNKKICLAIVTAILALTSFRMGVYNRCAQGIVTEDLSIQNRLDLWSSARKMFYAAPSGWGLGNSGDAYMSWFQPLYRHERYRTLVNSHLTWMVEFGWYFGWFYCWAWFTVLTVGWKVRKSVDDGLLIGECACLFVGGFFSSVLESLWVWIEPMIVFCIITIVANKVLMPTPECILKTGILSLMLILGLLFSSCADTNCIKASHAMIMIGTGQPALALYPDAEVLGGKHYGRELRSAIKKYGGSVHVITENVEVSVDVNLIVLCGKECIKAKSIANAYPRKKILVISPPSGFKPIEKQSANIHLWIGDLSESATQILDGEETNITKFPGADRYIPHWPEMIIALAKRL